MTQREFLVELARQLEAAGIPFMLAGSFCSSFHSQPRATNDIDFVIDPTPSQLDQWLTLLGDQIYVNRDTAHDALRRRSMFNIIDTKKGFKADLMIRKADPFHVEEFQRRQPGTVQGHLMPIATREDIILAKLEWNLITPSERQLQDALDVAIAQWPRLDLAYLRKWAPELGVVDQLEELLNCAEKSPLRES